MIIGTSEMTIHSNLLFLMADITETLMMDVQSMMKKEGFELRHEAKRNFNTAIASIRKLKNSVSGCSQSTQENFGNDSDHMYEFIKLLIDRCGEDDEKMFKFYNYIKSFPSQCHMNNLDSSVFNCLGK